MLFDEAATSDTTHGGGRVAALVIGPNVKKGFKFNRSLPAPEPVAHDHGCAWSQHLSRVQPPRRRIWRIFSRGHPILGQRQHQLQHQSNAEPVRRQPHAYSHSLGVCINRQWRDRVLTDCREAWASPVHFIAAAKSTLPITAMRIYIDGVSAYLTSAANLDVSLAVGSGMHSVVVQAWDSGGTVFKTPLSLTVVAGVTVCSAASAGVTVCSPAAGATTGTPLHVTAAAKSSVAPITTMRIYVDSVSKYNVNASSIDTSLAISAGTHNLVVQAWDSTGAVFKNSRTITVQ